MDEILRFKILEGRKAVDIYRATHHQLHNQLWHGGIPGEHTPLLNKMLAELNEQGFNSLPEFWNGSEELNIQGLGFQSREDFEDRAIDSDKKALEEAWR